MTKRLVLWDVDGTLLHTHGAGSDALYQAAAWAGGLTDVPQITMSGKTDPRILREILTEAGLEPDKIDAVMPEAIRAAEEALAGSVDRMKREARPVAGIEGVLEAFDEQPGVRQSLVTGNLKPNAALKIGIFGFERFIDLEIGAYGSDHHDRNELVPIAMRRVRELRSEIYEPDEVWVIGDTEHDLACARVVGARCLLVNERPERFVEIKKLDADAWCENFVETDEIVRTVLG